MHILLRRLLRCINQGPLHGLTNMRLILVNLCAHVFLTNNDRANDEVCVSYGTCQLPLRVCVLSWLPWPARPLLVSLTSPLCCSESEDSSDLNSRIYSSNSLCFRTCSFRSLSCPMYCTLSLTVCECTPCQQSKPHQCNRFFFRGVMTLALMPVRPGLHRQMLDFFECHCHCHCHCGFHNFVLTRTRRSSFP